MVERVEPAERNQIDRALACVRAVLGDDVVGAYLFGSAVLGGLKPRSDLDLMVVSTRPMKPDEKGRMQRALRNESRRPRHLEVTVVLRDQVRPWRYPPRMDLQYGDWLLEEFDRGNLEPWGAPENPDLASLIRMVLAGDATLFGPPPADVFDPVPRSDYVAALAAGVPALLADLEWDMRNVILTLARVWAGIATDELRSKDQAADWALPRLPDELRPVLARARTAYLGDEDEPWDDLRPEVDAYARCIVAEIERAAAADRHVAET
jgi:streptomycin 3"-adenylyltransferase